MEVRANGSKLWRYRYRIAGKENVFAIGSYPEVKLANAREDLSRARALVRQGVHPSHNRKAERIRQAYQYANTFEAMAEEWLTEHAEDWARRTVIQRRNAFKRHVYSYIGALPLAQVTSAHVLDVLKRIEKNSGPVMAVFVRQWISAVFRRAIVTLRAEIDPAAPLDGAIKTKPTQHRKALTKIQLPAFLAALQNYNGSFSNRIALELMLLLFTRTGELVGARWEEFDVKSAEWRIPGERMKMGDPHIVPLPRQAVHLLKKLYVVTGHGEYLFPSRSNPRKPASKGVLWKAVVAMGYAGQFSPHGFRATASTLLNEMGFRADVIERQLAHQERNKSRKSYNHAEYLPERRQMMQQWADYVYGLAGGTNVVPLMTGDAA